MYLKLRGYRLPTEAEWEYSCRSGSAAAYCFGDSEAILKNYAYYSKNSGSKMFPVGSLKPNDFGLFDMHGNAWKWCQNVYQFVHITEKPDGDLTVADHEGRVLRGGSFYNFADLVRAAYRSSVGPGDRNRSGGFRLARTYP